MYLLVSLYNISIPSHLVIVLISGLLVGLTWALVGSKLTLWLFNLLNMRRFGSTKFTDGSLMHNLFISNKQEHFVIVYKNDCESPIAVGFFTSTSDPNNERVEFDITEYPEYIEEFKRMSTTNEPSYLRNVLHVYIDATNDLVIVETEYPPEWGISYKKEKIV